MEKVLDPRELAAVAAAAPNLSVFAGELLDRLQRVVGYDVAYHAHAPTGESPVFAAQRGLSGDMTAQMLERSAVYGAELEPIKVAASAPAARGVAIDSDVLSRPELEARAYYRELVAPAGGKHTLLAVGRLGGRVSSVTMLGRSGASFSARAVDVIRSIVPIVGIATRAHERTPPPLALSGRERELCEYVALGYTNDDIGKALGTSPRTVRNQLSALYTRVGAANRAELVALVGQRRPRG